MEKMKKLFHTTGTAHGIYSVGLTAVVVAIVVVVNLIFGQLPEKYRNIDVSSSKIYEITDTSRNFLKDLDTEVKFTVLAVKEEADERIRTFLSKYASLSKNISVEWIDPVLHPSALQDYDASENSIVVSCEKTGRNTTVTFDKIVVVDYSSYYYTGSISENEFDGEGQLTSAVNYVTSEAEKQIYRTAGHGESMLPANITELMDKNNYTVSEWNLLMNPDIPEDCDLLLMNAPANDLTEDERDAVLDYLAGGGKMMLLLGDTSSKDLPNLSAVMKEYGMEAADGYIADPQRCYQGNAFYIFPMLSVSGDMAKGLASEMVLLINAHGLNLTDPVRDTISTTSFMTTSNSGAAVTEDTQTEGTYTLGAVATETVSSSHSDSENEGEPAENADGDTENSDTENVGTEAGDTDTGNDSTDAGDTDTEDGGTEAGDADTENVGTEAGDTDTGNDSGDAEDTKETRLTVISTANMIDSQLTETFTTLENTTLFMNAVTANFDGVENLSIEPKSLAVQYNTIQHVGLLSLFAIFGIPLVILVGGFTVWFRRRKA
ncbi:Gldg family protein [Schaedlerella arabinosiphila]|uniref:Gldg family protein n=1 Tax=Schaedlerella arabinosiphila TaxID=2044587 RepID=UPI002557F13C|nr:Gldg family protein [Schaedlerella arabinosiphila]